jgi:arylsulfatase A-like enzyme
MSQVLNATTGNPLSAHDKLRLEANYSGRLGGLKAVDDQVKTLVATLKSTKQLDNTLIVFTSDNGWIQGEHRVPGDKYLPYEESLRIPLLMRGPGIPANRKVSTLVTNVDFAATLLDAAKVTSPGRTQDGVSLLGVAKGTSTIASRAIGLEANAPLFADASMPQQWDQPYRGVRTDRYKYVVWGTGEEELYDLQTDPYELTNQSTNSSYSAIKAALIAKTESLKTCVGTGCRVSQ